MSKKTHLHIRLTEKEKADILRDVKRSRAASLSQWVRFCCLMRRGVLDKIEGKK